MFVAGMAANRQNCERLRRVRLGRPGHVHAAILLARIRRGTMGCPGNATGL